MPLPGARLLRSGSFRQVKHLGIAERSQIERRHSKQLFFLEPMKALPVQKLLALCSSAMTEEEFDDVFVLQDQDVTSAAVNNLMFGYFARLDNLGPEDRFLFYYSGHGSNETGVGQMQFSKAESDLRLYNAEANLPVNTWKDWGHGNSGKGSIVFI